MTDLSLTREILEDVERMLTEEDSEASSTNMDNLMALQAIEKSFYQVLDKKMPSPSTHEHPFSTLSPYSRDYNVSSSSNALSRSNLNEPFALISANSGVISSLGSGFGPDTMSGDENPWVLQFRRGLEEAEKFIPHENLLKISVEKNKELPGKSNDGVQAVAVGVGKDPWRSLLEGARRKKHLRESIAAGRSLKLLATYEEEDELSKLFDRIFVNPKGGKLPPKPIKDLILFDLDAARKQSMMQNKQEAGLLLPNAKGSTLTQISEGDNTVAVNLESLLGSCAQAIAAGDVQTANELFEHISLQSSALGGGSQRCAHYFSYAIETRLAGTAVRASASLDLKHPSSLQIMKAYETLSLACPFRRLGFWFTIRHILNLARKKSPALHIIDFGILNGFRWIEVIQELSAMPGGPPKLRITGIEEPQAGFRPAEMVEKTGDRLAEYCKRFNVPFEYNGIISCDWHTISIEDLRIDPNEAIAVTCMIRFEKLLDEINGEDNSPRSAVLKLIRKINPSIFIHSIVNGSFNAPTFYLRFREALGYYLAWFDLLDSNFSRESSERVLIERHYFGRSILNIVACEGQERVERAETYKQWQQRMVRTGFRPLPLDRQLFEALGAKLKAGYHKDFVIDEDGYWLLEGWKGRMLFGICCWVPTE